MCHRVTRGYVTEYYGIFVIKSVYFVIIWRDILRLPAAITGR